MVSRFVVSIPLMWALQVLICTLAFSVFHMSCQRQHVAEGIRSRGHISSISASVLLGEHQ